jgi:hypothetical protein
LDFRSNPVRTQLDSGGNTVLYFGGVPFAVYDSTATSPAVLPDSWTNISPVPTGRITPLFNRDWNESGAAVTTTSTSWVSTGRGLTNLQTVGEAQIFVWQQALASNNTAGDGVSFGYYFSPGNAIPALGNAPAGGDIVGNNTMYGYSALANQVFSLSGIKRYTTAFQTNYALYSVFQAVTGGTAKIQGEVMYRMEV